MTKSLITPVTEAQEAQFENFIKEAFNKARQSVPLSGEAMQRLLSNSAQAQEDITILLIRNFIDFSGYE